MLLLSTLLSLSHFPLSQSVIMVVVYAGVMDWTGPASTQMGLGRTDCVEMCRNDDNCLFVTMNSANSCERYDYSPGAAATIGKSSKEKGEIMGFKSDLTTDQCPETPDTITFAKPTTEPFTFASVQTSLGWILAHCAQSYTVTNRNNQFGCQKFFTLTDQSKAAAKTTCSDQLATTGKETTLSGLYSPDEFFNIHVDVEEAGSVSYQTNGVFSGCQSNRVCSSVVWGELYTKSTAATFSSVQTVDSSMQEGCLHGVIQGTTKSLQIANCDSGTAKAVCLYWLY